MYAAICNIQIELHELNDKGEAIKLVSDENLSPRRLISIRAETVDECVRKVNEQLRNV